MYHNGEFVTPGTIGEWVNVQAEEKKSKREWIHNKQSPESVRSHQQKRNQKDQVWWDEWGKDQARIAAAGMAISEQVVYLEQDIA